MSALLMRLRELLVEERGESLISVALCLSIMLGFTFGVMQIGLAYYSKERISEMAREAGRYAIVHGSTCTNSSGSCSASSTQVASFAQNLGYPNLGGGTTNCTAAFWTSPTGPAATSTPPNPPQNYVHVVCTYTFPYHIPFMQYQSLTFSSASTMLIMM